jgi:hypothetical protein
VREVDTALKYAYTIKAAATLPVLLWELLDAILKYSAVYV